MAIQYANITKLENDLTDIADTIRTKTGKNEKLNFPDDYNEELEKLYCAADFTDLSNPKGLFKYDGTFTGYLDRQEIFWGRTGITEVIFTNATFIPTQMFRDVASITKVTADKAEIIYNLSLAGNRFTSIALPSCYKVTSAGFRANSSVQIIDLGGTNEEPSIAANAFLSDSNLTTLILRSSILYSLENISAFNYTPFASGKSGGTLYVPQTLITSYQQATNWSTILNYPNNNILSIEGSQWETTYGDGRLIANVNNSNN